MRTPAAEDPINTVIGSNRMSALPPKTDMCSN
jgi:hypothetical protein